MCSIHSLISYGKGRNNISCFMRQVQLLTFIVMSCHYNTAIRIGNAETTWNMGTWFLSAYLYLCVCVYCMYCILGLCFIRIILYVIKMMMEKEASGLYPFLIFLGKSVLFVFVPKKMCCKTICFFLYCLCLRLPFIFW